MLSTQRKHELDQAVNKAILEEGAEPALAQLRNRVYFTAERYCKGGSTDQLMDEVLEEIYSYKTAQRIIGELRKAADNDELFLGG